MTQDEHKAIIEALYQAAYNLSCALSMVRIVQGQKDLKEDITAILSDVEELIMEQR